jgi:hypothetical protein
MQTLATPEKSKSSSSASFPKTRQQPFFPPVHIQPKLTVGAASDPYEQQADAMAERVMRMPAPAKENSFFSPANTAAVQRKCASCEEEEKVQRKVAGGSNAQAAPPVVHEVLNSGGGKPLDAAARSFMEPRFNSDFSRVRIHDDTQAARSAEAIRAHAYTSGNQVVFNSGQYNPATTPGRKLLAHELTHVLQQNASISRKPTAGLVEEPEEGIGIGGMVQRQVAEVPAEPEVATVVLSEAEMRRAIQWNQRRFHDPYNIMNVRETIGISKYPAIIDEEFVNAVMDWQASQGLDQDGKFGASSTQSVVDELTAEGATHEAETLSLDNTVDTVDVIPQTYNTCALGPPFEFNWQVGLRTTLRNGFIIQRIDNTFNATMCGGGAYVGWQPIPRYWEAWRVDANGNVSPAIGGVNDMFTRPLLPNSSGTWRMVGTLYTTRTLPASFVASSVADAGILRATLTNPGSDFLGYVSNTRRVGGTWNCCAAPPTHVRS